MHSKHFSDKFIAAQVAGSCRLEGIRVSADEEKLMCDIIAGKVDAVALRHQLVQQYQAQNSATLEIASA